MRTRRTVRGLVVAGALLLIAAIPGALLRGNDAKEITGDLKLMQGTWAFKPADDVDVTWSLVGDTLKATAQGQEYVCTVTLNPEATPRAIDFFFTQGPNEVVGKKTLGIYKIENEKVTFCVSMPGDDHRPSEFKEVDNESFVLSFAKAK